MRILGLDVGNKRIGVAASDELLLCAHGLCVYKRSDDASDMAYFADLSKKQRITHLVVGLPRNMDGSVGYQAEAAQSFGDALAKFLALPITYWDERLTTRLALGTLRECGASAKQRKGAVDKIAASHILQSYLDSLGEAQRAALIAP